MREQKVNEIIAEIKAFEKETYDHSEMLSEMIKLESELGRIASAFGYSVKEGSKLWEIGKCFEEKNMDFGRKYEDILNSYTNRSKELWNLIKAGISGAIGEEKAFSFLDKLNEKAIVLKNVELQDENFRTELDAIVITRTGITIVEVKNSKRDIFIDEEGGYYRVGEFLKYDCQIAEKMRTRERMVKEAIGVEDVDIPIQSVVVFTDNKIEVQNKCTSIKTCFGAQLTYYIKKFGDKFIFDDEKIEEIGELIKSAECKHRYPANFDVESFKEDFAKLIVAFENAEDSEDAKASLLVRIMNFMFNRNRISQRVQMA